MRRRLSPFATARRRTRTKTDAEFMVATLLAAPHLDEATAAAMLAVLSTEDLLEKIGVFACDPLRASTACSFAACCRLVRDVMREQLSFLRVRHAEASSLAAWLAAGVGVGVRCSALRDALRLNWTYRVALRGAHAHMRTLGALLGSGSLPLIEELNLSQAGPSVTVGADGVVALFDGLGRGAAPRLRRLVLEGNQCGPEGAAALGGALERGAMPRLAQLYLGGNALGDAGLAALAAPLRRRPALEALGLSHNALGAAGLRALVGELGAHELKALEAPQHGHTRAPPGRQRWCHLSCSELHLFRNRICDECCAALAAALDGGALPALMTAQLYVDRLQPDHPTGPASAPERALRRAAHANDARRARADWHEQSGRALAALQDAEEKEEELLQISLWAPPVGLDPPAPPSAVGEIAHEIASGAAACCRALRSRASTSTREALHAAQAGLVLARRRRASHAGRRHTD